MDLLQFAQHLETRLAAAQNEAHWTAAEADVYMASAASARADAIRRGEYQRGLIQGPRLQRRQP